MVTMLEFRRNAAGVLKRVARGESLVLSYRGKPAARLEPMETTASLNEATDPFLTIGARAQPSPKGKTRHADINNVLYHRP